MFVEHPEFSDILVNLDINKTVASRDGVNDYFYENGMWIMSEVDSLSEPLTKEEYILHYCSYDEESGKHIYRYSV
jgi:hypothetical protein